MISLCLNKVPLENLFISSVYKNIKTKISNYRDNFYIFLNCNYIADVVEI